MAQGSRGGEDDQVQCLTGFGCQATASSSNDHAAKEEETMDVDELKQDGDDDDDDEDRDGDDDEEGDDVKDDGDDGKDPETPAPKKRGRKRSSTTGDTAVTKRRPILPGSKKRGIPKGSKITSNKKLDDWYFACKKFEEINKVRKLSQAEFLRSEESGDLFTGKVSEQQSFGRYLNKYKSGELKPTAKKRHYPRKYEEIEERLIKYYDLRSSLVGTNNLSTNKRSFLPNKLDFLWVAVQARQVWRLVDSLPNEMSRMGRRNGSCGFSCHTWLGE